MNGNQQSQNSDGRKKCAPLLHFNILMIKKHLDLVFKLL